MGIMMRESNNITTVDTQSWDELFEKAADSEDMMMLLKTKILEFKQSDGINKPIDEEGNTLLHLAIEYQDFEIVQYLIEQQADPNIKNNLGDSPFHITVLEYEFSTIFEEMCHYLIDHGADLNSKDRFEDTPVQKALMLGGAAALLEHLLLKGATFLESYEIIGDPRYRIPLEIFLLTSGYKNISDCDALDEEDYQKVLKYINETFESEEEKKEQEKNLECYQNTIGLCNILRNFKKIEAMLRKLIFRDVELEEFGNLQGCLKEMSLGFAKFANKLERNQKKNSFPHDSNLTLWASEKKSGENINRNKNPNEIEEHPQLIKDISKDFEPEEEKKEQEENLEHYKDTLDICNILHNLGKIKALIKCPIFRDIKFEGFENFQECFEKMGQKFAEFANILEEKENQKKDNFPQVALWVKKTKIENPLNDINKNENPKNPDDENNHSNGSPGL